tara:strand:+ start:6853 stop:7473 length:621 start_codon:yes stop_codon:yes gene_type:complete
MATQAVTSGITKNNGSTIVNAGNVPVTTKTINDAGFGKVIGDSEGRYKGNPGNRKQRTPSAGNFSAFSNGGVITAKGSGTFAYENAKNDFIGMRMTSVINGISNTSLLSGGTGKGRYRGSIHGLESYRTLPKYTTNADGSYASTSSAGGSDTSYIDSAGNGSTASSDSAANPTRAIPGELVYTGHSKARSGSLAVPTQTDYAAKTG